MRMVISRPNLVRMRGLEPPRPKAYAPKAYVYTNFTTSAKSILAHYSRMLDG